MGTRRVTFGLKALSLAYLVSASAFAVAIALNSREDWAAGAQQAAHAAAPYAKVAADAVRENAIKPAGEWLARENKAFFDWIEPPKPMVARRTAATRRTPAPVVSARPMPSLPPTLRPVIVEEPNKPAESAPPLPELAPQESALADLAPAPDTNPPSPGEISNVLSHMKFSLTKELFENFDLFLYVSKADHGPWSQRMFVFQKQASGDLNMLYSFPVSTGSEIPRLGPSGQLYKTSTPQGYYELDPERMYRRYHSSEWDHSMPYAMFFTWEHDGLQTGLAIHSATGDDISMLGKRASAGCVRLAPQNAQLLFRLIKANYKGLAPQFAYNRRTATMNNDGLLMHDASGNLKFAAGYKVLVLIENNGGDNIVAALF